MKLKLSFILLLSSLFGATNSFHAPQQTTRSFSQTIRHAQEDTKEKRGDNKAMSFLRKMGRVGGSANMDFANAMGLDESPSGGTKSSYHEGGFKVGNI